MGWLITRLDSELIVWPLSKNKNSQVTVSCGAVCRGSYAAKSCAATIADPGSSRRRLTLPRPTPAKSCNSM